VDSSRQAVARLTTEAKLIEIDGAQHGFAVPDGPGYLNSQTRTYQSIVIRSVIE
jgi:hypothetical protein